MGHAHVPQPAGRDRPVSIAARFGLGLILLTWAALATAGETSRGDYTVHHNAFASTNLTAEIARRTGIQQAGDKIVVLVNVRKAVPGQRDQAVTAEVTGSARDLLGNRRNLSFREVEEAGATDYVAQTRVSDEETLIFDLEVRPEKGPVIPVQFRQTFFTR